MPRRTSCDPSGPSRRLSMPAPHGSGSPVQLTGLHHAEAPVRQRAKSVDRVRGARAYGPREGTPSRYSKRPGRSGAEDAPSSVAPPNPGVWRCLDDTSQIRTHGSSTREPDLPKRRSGPGPIIRAGVVSRAGHTAGDRRCRPGRSPVQWARRIKGPWRSPRSTIAHTGSREATAPLGRVDSSSGGLSDDYVFSHVFSTHEVMEERRKIQEPGIFGIPRGPSHCRLRGVIPVFALESEQDPARVSSSVARVLHAHWRVCCCYLVRR